MGCNLCILKANHYCCLTPSLIFFSYGKLKHGQNTIRTVCSVVHLIHNEDCIFYPANILLFNIYYCFPEFYLRVAKMSVFMLSQGPTDIFWFPAQHVECGSCYLILINKTLNKLGGGGESIIIVRSQRCRVKRNITVPQTVETGRRRECQLPFTELYLRNLQKNIEQEKNI